MTPNVPRSVVTAGIILVAFLLYFGVRTATRADTPTEEAATVEEIEQITPTVQVREVGSELRQVFASLKGRTEPTRIVTVRSETTGVVESAPVQEGRFVKKGDVLCALSIDTREARVAEAEAALEASRLEYEAAKRLNSEGWTASNRAAAIRATYDQAEAAVKAARIELGRTKIRAPFDGVFERRDGEIGSFLSPGSSCGELVDLDPIIVVVGATESQALKLAVGTDARMTLSNGQTLDGRIRYIARTADSVTRTFRVEVEAANLDHSIPAGLTASVRIPLGEAPAIRLTPAALVLHDDGRVGVRYVSEENIVEFAPVDVIDDDPNGVWVVGLPERVTLVAEGQEYLREGVEVITQTREGF